jgi:hypothetical protein
VLRDDVMAAGPEESKEASTSQLRLRRDNKAMVSSCTRFIRCHHSTESLLNNVMLNAIRESTPSCAGCRDAETPVGLVAICPCQCPNAPYAYCTTPIATMYGIAGISAVVYLR